MLIEYILIKLEELYWAYEELISQIDEKFNEVYGVLRKNGYEEEYNAIKGNITANIALNKYLNEIINEYQNNVNKNFSKLIEEEI